MDSSGIQYRDTIDFRPSSKLLRLSIDNLLIECISLLYVLELIENTVVNNVLSVLERSTSYRYNHVSSPDCPFFGQGLDFSLTLPSESSSILTVLEIGSV